MVAKRAFQIAVLAGALSTVAQALPDQPLREEMIVLIEELEAKADALVGEFESTDELLVVAGLKSA